MLFKVLAAAALATSQVQALGINCKGSGLCGPIDNGILKQLLGQVRAIDSGKTYHDGDHVSCVQSPNAVGNPFLCAFYQKTGRSFTAGQTVSYLESLIDHGCKVCGSIPTDNGNNVDNGELTANFVSKDPQRRDVGGFANNVKRAAKAEIEAPTESQPKPEATPASDLDKKNALNLLTKRAGINCKGSSTCGVGGIGHSPAGNLRQVRDAIASGDDGSWGEGEHVACVTHVTGRLCAFYQNVGNRRFSKDQSVAYADSLLSHDCRVCGSVPTDSGNNVANGEMTINYVSS